MSNPLLIFSAVAATALIFSGAQYFYNRKREKEQAFRQKIQALMEAHRQRQLPSGSAIEPQPDWEKLMTMAAAPASANPSRLWQQPNLIALGVVVMALAVVWIVLAIRPDHENKNETTAPNAQAEANPSQRPAVTHSGQPQLELLKMVHSHRDTRLLLEGLVKNISSDTLKNLTAVAIFYDDDESFLTSDVGQLAFNMLLPEEKAPFRIWTLDNHRMRRFEVNFRDDRGAPLQLADHRESPHDYINLPSSTHKEHKKEGGEEHDHEVHK